LGSSCEPLGKEKGLRNESEEGAGLSLGKLEETTRRNSHVDKVRYKEKRKGSKTWTVVDKRLEKGPWGTSLEIGGDHAKKG